MRISKWRNSLAVWLPVAVVDALDPKEGEHIELQVAGARTFEIQRKPDHETRIAACTNVVDACPRISNGIGWNGLSDRQAECVARSGV